MSTTSERMPFVAGSLAGRPVRRVEDAALLTGRGTYVDNLRVPGELRATFVRSPFAHAEVRSVEVAAAARMPGVVAVYTAESLAPPGWAGFMQLHPDVIRPSLATGRVNFVGDTVAVVISETEAQGVDAAELVEVEYEPLPAAVDMEAALEPGAPLQFVKVPGNLVVGSRDPAGASVLDGADVVVRGRFENQRVAVAPMEGSAVVVVPGDSGNGTNSGNGTAPELTVHLACQMPHGSQAQLAGLFGIPKEHVRVIAPDVGGAFGAKHLSAEAVVAVSAARLLGRPVRWVETRSENMVSMPHGRGQVQYIELGINHDGTIVGLHCRIVGDAGAYAGFGGMLPGMMTRMMASGVYKIPKISFDVAVALTNTTTMGAYRGAGRPEAAAFVERIMDMAADELGMDPVELRLRNLIQPGDFPYTTVTGARYDSGDYQAALTEALRLAGYDDLRAEQAHRRRHEDRLQLGIGLSVYVEITGSGGSEYAIVEVDDGGGATVSAGTSAHGQGHATAFSMLVADRLNIPMERIRYVQSDTAVVARGGGTGGSRSLQLGGNAVAETAVMVAARGRAVAAEMFEAAPDDIVLDAEGNFGVAGVPARKVSWAEVSRAASDAGEPLVVEHDGHQDGATFPFGAHVSVVEVDTETGLVTPLRHIAVDDCGRILNPLLVDGQVHGGLASGISQALWEEFVYDADGNPLTATLAEYGMPSAAELVSFEVAHTEVPSPLNSLGAKGIGESATVGSTPAVQNAVVDALSHLGIRHLDIPCTPERVWRAITEARAGHPAPPWREPPAVFSTLPVSAQADAAAEEEAEDFNL
ncbi:MAG: xanthine dehydrogenase family protein molybdopterin-binding subunit [Actinomycetota bacterium]|nr:xanthine dehydrogenase family protein molybdopterin-binding subunit [Actinomycetota bacterium]